MVILNFDISYDYRPWGQAKEVYERIQYEDKLDLLQQYFEELYPEGLQIVDINDILSYDSEDVLQYLGMMDEDEEEEEDEEILTIEEAVKKYDSYDEICDKYGLCNLCPLYAENHDYGDDCENAFNIVKEKLEQEEEEN